jgi:hypothetical protein
MICEYCGKKSKYVKQGICGTCSAKRKRVRVFVRECQKLKRIIEKLDNVKN